MKIQKFDLIVALYVFGIITAGLMGAKVMPLGHAFGLTFNISVAIFLMPLLYTIIDVVSEIYGRERARSLVWSGLVTLILLVLFSMLATHLPAAARFTAEPAYQEVFGMSIRFAIASIAAFAFSEMLDILVYNKIKKAMHGKMIWLRNNVSNFLGELVDSIIFMTIAYYGMKSSFGENVVWLIGLILPYWIAKCVMSVIGTPLVYAGIAYLKKRKKTSE
jgi:uncharacterized integral membrane protein (TIGR00697 family)